MTPYIRSPDFGSYRRSRWVAARETSSSHSCTVSPTGALGGTARPVRGTDRRRAPFDPLRGPALRSRDEVRAHFRPTGEGPRLDRTVEDITVHETTDPEVIVAEFSYLGTVVETGESFTQPAIFVLHVRDGEIVRSRDYFDHVTGAAIRGRLDDLVAAVNARRP
ncbi:nuclear transport factor 2 family protein [Actinophytocola algeriensis]|nr:nuclear transport factor 2 family protein [Actinophytocola algeriensis]